jgi:hypothetical protein
MKRIHDMTNHELTGLVREAIRMLENGGTGAVPRVVTSLQGAGVIAGTYVGMTDMTPREILVWYAGQILDVLLDRNKWFAINSIINCVDKFAPALETQ